MTPLDKRSTRVLLFGTSGNPPTGFAGHSGIVHYFAENRAYDEIWVLPVYEHMFAHKREALASGTASFGQRLEMCRLAFEKLSNSSTTVRALPLERDYFLARKAQGEMENMGTYDLVKLLQAEHPTHQACPPPPHFSLALGMDAARDLLSHKWKCSKELLELVTLTIVNRK
ncbi:unnamed protein product, partial [Chrysoparadoxa australica]